MFVNFVAEGAEGGSDTIEFSDLSAHDLDGGAIEYSNANGTTLELTWDDGADGGTLLVANMGENIEQYTFCLLYTSPSPRDRG